jgi:hypothetical protein
MVRSRPVQVGRLRRFCGSVLNPCGYEDCKLSCARNTDHPRTCCRVQSQPTVHFCALCQTLYDPIHLVIRISGFSPVQRTEYSAKIGRLSEMDLGLCLITVVGLSVDRNPAHAVPEEMAGSF